MGVAGTDESRSAGTQDIAVGSDVRFHSASRQVVNRGCHKFLLIPIYTANSQEALTVLAGSGWRDEGVACYVYGTPQPNTTDLFRRYNPTTGEHFYTADPTEAQNVLSSGFTDEGTACYVYAPGRAAAGTVPFYRLFK